MSMHSNPFMQGNLCINPWADQTPRSAKQPVPTTPEPKAHPILMAARARRARRTKQQAKAEASQAATA